MEAGEVITFTITVTPRDGAATGVILGDVISDPSNVLTNIDAGSGTYDPASSSITWNLGAIAQDATQTLTWSATIACGSADGLTADDQATAFGVGVARARGKYAADKQRCGKDAEALSCIHWWHLERWK